MERERLNQFIAFRSLNMVAYSTLARKFATPATIVLVSTLLTCLLEHVKTILMTERLRDVIIIPEGVNRQPQNSQSEQ